MGADGKVDVVVRDARERGRYEALVGDAVAGFVEYDETHGSRAFIHTVVSDDFEGRGVGSALAKAALDDLRAKGLTVRPVCPFIAGWIRRHPDYLDLLAEGFRDRVGTDNT